MDHASFILHYYNFRGLFLIIIFLILLVFFLWGFLHEERTQLIQTVERKNTILKVNGSLLGVMNAAPTNKPTTACRLYL